jgi:hypothetical protein
MTLADRMDDMQAQVTGRVDLPGIGWPPADLVGSITEQALDMAFPDAPGFTGQGWHSQETVMAVRWLLANPDAWGKAMDTARQHPGNLHTVADTLHEDIVPRSVLEDIARDGGDPAKVDWLEVAHELIERRNDPQPGSEHAGIAAQALDLAAAAPGDTAAAMHTVHLLDDTGRHLAHASAHLDAAMKAPPGDLRGHHTAQCATALDGAHAAAHDLAAHLRAHYPAEGAELDTLTGVVGLAVAVSDQAKTATTAHLVQTTCNHLGHTIEHVRALGDDKTPEVQDFNADHARTHLDGAIEHVGKLTRHLADNYPAEAGHLDALRKAAAQIAAPETVSGQVKPIT